MKSQLFRWMVVLSLLIFGIGSFPGSAFAEDYTFLDMSDFTGPVAGLALPGSIGLEDYLKDLNARGGVDGVKVKYLGLDTRYDVARALSAFKRHWRDKKVIAINTISTPLGKILEKLTRKEKIVMLCPGDGQWQAKLGNFMTWGPAYQDAFAATLDWIK
jgi:ABC-type branched-subunit amino acid transport system substrate-binding protein